MKNIYFILIFYIINCTNINYQIPLDSNSEIVKIHSINSHFFLIEDFNYWKTNSLFYISDTNVYFFSSGWCNKSAEQILWKAKTLTYLPFKGLFLISPELEFSGGINQFAEEHIPIYIQKEGYDFLLLNWKQWQFEMQKKFLSWQTIENLPVISGLIESELRLEKENIILFYPGNIISAGNLVLYFKNEEILYAGNLLHNPEEFILNLNKNQIKRLLDLIQKLKKMPVKTIITGKGRPIQNKSLFDKMYKYYNNLL
ncbi:MAG: hypothetical protein KatS3mg129_2733 [Leptospiraceae bacterium]|nr:MAG: hypothetical protein KatS3mg129_2733 [Leptospiraceae bacterium]